jgi:hypothetical protein
MILKGLGWEREEVEKIDGCVLFFYNFAECEKIDS